MRRPALVGVALIGLVSMMLAPVGSSVAAGSAFTWSGTWSRSEDGVNGNLILTQTGASVTGHYTWNDGTGTVGGSVNGAGITYTGGFNETNYKGSFVLTLSSNGKAFTGSYTGVNKNTQGDIAGPFDGHCIGGACLNNGAAPPPPSGSHAASAASLAGEVTVVHANGSQEPLAAGGTLKRGDQLQTGVDSHVVLSFPDGSTMRINEMAQIQVADLTVQGSRQNVSIAIKLGEMSAQVNPQKAYQTDFKVSTPSGTLSSRGTKFSVFYNAATKTTIVRTTEHSVSFAPSRKGAKAVIVPAGKEIVITPTSVSALAPIGKAGARGGVDMQTAANLVIAVIDRETSACHLAAARGTVSVRPGSSSAWSVTVAVPGQSTSSWSVVKGKVTAVNARAIAIAAACVGP